MHIEFDPAKARANRSKHGVTFEEAATWLPDPKARVREDALTAGELRWILLGMSEQVRLLVVVYTLRGDNPRLISARKATAKEKNYA